MTDSEFTTNQTIEIKVDAVAQQAGNNITSVVFYANDELLSTDVSTPFSYNWSGISSGEYIIKAIATDSEGTVGKDSVAVSVIKVPEVVSLKTGWNLIGCPLNGNPDLKSALSSIWDNVEVVKDFQGFYDKNVASSLNSLNSLMLGKGYFIYVTQDCQLDWIVR